MSHMLIWSLFGDVAVRKYVEHKLMTGLVFFYGCNKGIVFDEGIVICDPVTLHLVHTLFVNTSVGKF